MDWHPSLTQVYDDHCIKLFSNSAFKELRGEGENSLCFSELAS